MFLYKSAVTKHGSHNQKTHAGSRGGGGGGAGGGSSKPANSSGEVSGKKIDAMVGQLDGATKEIGAGFADARNSGFQVKELQNLMDGTKRLGKANANLKKLKTLIASNISLNAAGFMSLNDLTQIKTLDLSQNDLSFLNTKV